jgi:hypothetical protein
VSTAWIQDGSEQYGYNRYPFGHCEESSCQEAACYSIPTANDNGNRLVCLDHKPKELFFVPFLGQQTKLFAATERYVLGGGGAGGSKTYAGARLWLKQHREEHERWELGEIEHSDGWAIFFRRTMKMMLKVVSDFKRYCHLVSPEPHSKWREQEKLWECECGYKVQFGGMEDDDDWENYYGGEYTLVVFDEAWQFTKKQITEIDSRIRCGDHVLGAKVQLYLLTNPIGSETKKWMKRRFVDVAEPETPVLIRVTLTDGRVEDSWQVYIPSNVFNNPALTRDGKYEANLRRKSRSVQQMLLHNDWEIDEGSWVGEDWDRERHVIYPHAIPASWPRFKCGDYGFSSKSSVLWIAVDPSGGLVCYRAWSGRNMTARQVGQRVRQIESQPLWVKNARTGQRFQVVGKEWDDSLECSTIRGPMDAALWARNGEDGESRGEILETLGTGFYPSDKGTNIRHSAAEHIREQLRAVLPDPFREGETVPGLRFFKGTTETRMLNEDGESIVTGPTHTIPTLPADENDPDVWDTDGDDHDMDALAYGEQTRPHPGDRDEAVVIDFLSFRANRSEAGDGPVRW